MNNSKKVFNRGLENVLRRVLPEVMYSVLGNVRKEGGGLEVFEREAVKGIMASLRGNLYEIFGGLEEDRILGIVDVIERACLVVVRSGVDLFVQSSELNTSFLTGLPNQRIGVRIIKELIRLKRPFAWTFFDLDRLKAMNLAFGEHVTDRLIFALGQRVKQNIRSNEPNGLNDLVVHRSGDEFWLILNGADLRGGMIATENLVKKIHAEPFEVKVNLTDLNYMNEVREKLSGIGKREEFEEIAFGFVQNALDDFGNNGGRVLNRMGDEKIHFIRVRLSVSAGCVPFVVGEEMGDDVDVQFENMSARIKFAEEMAKISGRGCVRGFDGSRYFLLADKDLVEL